MSGPPRSDRSVHLAVPPSSSPTRPVGRRKQARCREHGLEAHDPGEEVDLDGLEPVQQPGARFVGRGEMMDPCVAGLADVGTAFEMGRA